MMMMKVARPPLVFDASLLPLGIILLFSLFVVWQWCSQPIYDLSFSTSRDPAVVFPLHDALQNSYPDANNHGLANVEPLEENNCCRCATKESRREENARKHNLLHSWSDQELFGRAIVEELGREGIPLESTMSDCSRIDDSAFGSRKAYRLKSDSSVSCHSFCGKKGSDSLAPPSVKIAFLFMITTSLPFEALWNNFFDGKEGLFNIYVHADPFRANLFNRSSGVFWSRLIPSSKASRGSPSLVLASNRLIANAMLDDPSNQYFALFSGHCIPIRSFDHVYKVITSSQQSFLEQIRNESVMWERYTGREGGEETMKPEIPFDQFRKASQWFVFTQKHALMILQDVHERKYWDKFDRKCVIYFCGTDEHYYPTLLNILDPNGVSGKTVTYVEWPDYVSEHPVMFYPYQISRKFVGDIQEKDDGQYLFARKFHESTVDLLMNVTDMLLG